MFLLLLSLIYIFICISWGSLEKGNQHVFEINENCGWYI